MASELTDEQMKEFKSTFKLFDRNGDNHISVTELGTVIRGLGHNPTQAELEDMIKEVDANENGYIEFNEFLKVMSQKPLLSAIEQEKEIIKAFQQFDSNGDGYITKTELHFAMTQIGEKLTEEEVQDMIQEADVDGDGRVNYVEFSSKMR